jgi:hypothetical protein
MITVDDRDVKPESCKWIRGQKAFLVDCTRRWWNKDYPWPGQEITYCPFCGKIIEIGGTIVVLKFPTTTIRMEVEKFPEVGDVITMKGHMTINRGHFCVQSVEKSESGEYVLTMEESEFE